MSKEFPRKISPEIKPLSKELSDKEKEELGELVSKAETTDKKSEAEPKDSGLIQKDSNQKDLSENQENESEEEKSELDRIISRIDYIEKLNNLTPTLDREEEDSSVYKDRISNISKATSCSEDIKYEDVMISGDIGISRIFVLLGFISLAIMLLVGLKFFSHADVLFGIAVLFALFVMAVINLWLSYVVSLAVQSESEYNSYPLVLSELYEKLEELEKEENSEQ